MTIRSAILLGCMGLTLVTAGLGLFNRWTEREVGVLAGRIYDQAFMGMSYLRSAQNGFARAAGECRFRHAGECGLLLDRIPDILQDLGIAQDRALSPLGYQATIALGASLRALTGRLQTGNLADIGAELDRIDGAFGTVVEILAGDGYRERRGVATVVARANRDNLVAILVAVGVGLAITALLSTRIVRPLRRAVLVAQAIAAGRLDPPAAPKGRSEPAQLLRALAQLCMELTALGAREATGRQAEQDAVVAAATARVALASQYEATVGGVAAGVIRTAGEQAQLMGEIGVQTAKSAKSWANVADATRTATAEAQAMSAATEQLSISVMEISRQVEVSAEMAKEAASVVEATDATVQSLAASAVRIGDVVRLIGD
ncbi:MAG: HAMP domain-containing protein, partial [Pseudomonadota bacterium]|nr:HAMP domain-containing protein [Pseudomonadota bacterium]